MGVSNFGLKIRSKVKYWPFLRMRSRNTAKISQIVVRFSKFPTT